MGSLAGILSSVAAFCWICGQKARAAAAPLIQQGYAGQRASSVMAVIDCNNVRVVPPKINCQSQECV